MTSDYVRFGNRIVLHVDMDAFFAAIEERDNPQFRGLPIVVGADPKGGFGRGVVSTANYVARKYGIRSAMPISWAYRACPTAIFLPCDFRRYGRSSRNIMEILRSFGTKFEQVSVDEAYLEINQNLNFKSQNPMEGAVRLAGEIKKQIKIKEGLSCSVGIGPNKLLAKIASDFRKPNGLTVVPHSRVQTFLDPLSARTIPGIGPKTADGLLRLGIVTIRDLRLFSEDRIISLFGKHGKRMAELARGEDARILEGERAAKSVGRQTTFDKDTKDSRIIMDVVFEMLEEVFAETRELGLLGQTVTVVVRYGTFDTHTSQQKSRRVLDLKEARRLAMKLILPYFTGKPIRLVGVRISSFGSGKSDVVESSRAAMV